MDQRPNAYPKPSDLVNRLIEDIQAVLGALAISPEDMKVMKDKFHVSVRLHRHEQERFGKKWKRTKTPGVSRFWA